MRCRSTVHPLVIEVSGSLSTGFSSYEAAASDYYAAKAVGQVVPVRDSGDEYIYGPLSNLVCSAELVLVFYAI